MCNTVVSTFLVFMFVDQLLLVDLFSHRYYPNTNNIGGLPLFLVKIMKNR